MTWHLGACQVLRKQSQHESDFVCDSVYKTQCFGNFITAASLSPLVTTKNTVIRSTDSEIISVLSSIQIINLILHDYQLVLNWTDARSYMGRQHSLGIPPAPNMTDNSFIFLSSTIKKKFFSGH